MQPSATQTVRKSQYSFVSTRRQRKLDETNESPIPEETVSSLPPKTIDIETDAQIIDASPTFIENAQIIDASPTFTENASASYPRSTLLHVRNMMKRSAEVHDVGMRPVAELPETFQTPDWKQRNPMKPMLDPKVAADDELVLKSVGSILGKLTPETIGTGYENLMTCGVDTPGRILILMYEVFDAAQMQQPLIPMYADLCEKLAHDRRISSILETAQDNFPQLLLRQCQKSVASLFAPRHDEHVPEKILLEEENLHRKRQALGSVKLIGHLLVKKMIAPRMFVDWAQELLAKRDSCPAALESLAAFLMVAGPEFDTSAWEHYPCLQEIIAAIRKVAKSKSTPPRARYILQDVLDSRDAGWLNNKEKRNTQNVRSSEVSVDVAKPKPTTSAAADRLEVSLFDVVAFRRIFSSVLADLVATQDVVAAVQRIRLVQVPIACQGQQTADMLTRILEEKRGPHRRRALSFVMGLVASEQAVFDRKIMLDGVSTFFQDIYEDLCHEVPRLSSMVATELVPLLLGVYTKAEVSNVVPIEFYCQALRA